jgi:hypothetical protein
MARRPKRVAVMAIQPYHAADAMNTISRAREHLANPKMVAAIRQHMDGLNAALTGGMAPKKPRPNVKRKGMP